MRRRALIAQLALLCVFSLDAGAQTEREVRLRANDLAAATTEDRERVLNILLAAARDARGQGERLQAATFLNRAGHLQMRLALNDEALSSFQQALALAGASNSSVRVDALNGAASAYGNLSDCDRAATLARTAFKRSKKIDYVAGRAAALLTLSDCQNYSDHVQAIVTARKALRLWQSIDDRPGMARAYTSLADYLLSRNELTESTQNAEAALNLWRELNLPAEQSEAQINLGFIEYRKGAWENCLSLLAQAQTLIDEKAEPFKMGQIAAGIGEAFIENGMPEVGLAKLQQAAEYYRLAKSQRNVIGMQWDIGRTYYLLARYAEALATLNQALLDARTLKEPGLIALCEDYLGRASEATGEQATALTHYQAALRQYDTLGNRREVARLTAVLGKFYERRGQIDEARKSYRTALTKFAALDDRVNQSATLYALGNMELGQGELDSAEANLRQAIDLTENIRRVSTSRDLTTAFSATVHDRYQGYIECLMRKHERNPAMNFPAQALEISELARGRALAELLRATQTSALPSIDGALAEREKSVRQSLREKEDYLVTLLATRYHKAEVDALRDEIAQVASQYDEVVQTIRTRYPSFDEILRPAAWDLQKIQTEVINDDETVVIEYSLGVRRSYVWAITKTGIKFSTLPSDAEIASATRAVADLLRTAPNSKTPNDSPPQILSLSALLLAPVADEIRSHQRVIVVADGALNSIPFQALYAPPFTDAEPLVARHEILNAPSASILGQLQEEATHRQPPGKIVAAFGDPVFASNYEQAKNRGSVNPSASSTDVRWQTALRDIDADNADAQRIQPLFFARRELANLREVVGDAGVTAGGFDASRERLQTTKLADFAILHFATHAILDPKHPERSGLFLSTIGLDGRPREGFVGLSDVYQMHAPVSLVVLSACQTGLGKEVRGEGLIGLTRGFMYAGASSVMASLWQVDDEATAELMKRFYENLIERKMPPGAALREAQNALRREPQWSSPYYWAAFTLQGDYRNPIMVKPQADSAGEMKFIGAALIVLMMTLFFSHRRMRRSLPRNFIVR